MTVSMKYWTRGMLPNWKTKATAAERSEACWLWHKGKSTHEIAHEINVYEAVLYNELPKWRGES